MVSEALGDAPVSSASPFSQDKENVLQKQQTNSDLEATSRDVVDKQHSAEETDSTQNCNTSGANLTPQADMQQHGRSQSMPLVSSMLPDEADPLESEIGREEMYDVLCESLTKPDGGSPLDLGHEKKSMKQKQRARATSASSMMNTR